MFMYTTYVHIYECTYTDALRQNTSSIGMRAVYMYEYIYSMCMYITYVHIYECAYTNELRQKCIEYCYARVTQTQTEINTYLHIHIYINIYTSIYIYTCIYIHTYTYIYIYIFVHTYLSFSLSVCLSFFSPCLSKMSRSWWMGRECA